MGSATSKSAEDMPEGWQIAKNPDRAVRGGEQRVSSSGASSPHRDEDRSVHIGHAPTRQLVSVPVSEPGENPFLVLRAHMTNDADKLVLVLVGLPARGKSIIAHKLVRFLTWLGTRTRVFSVGQYRREQSCSGSASFFNAEMKIASAIREKLNADMLEIALDWLDAGGEVAIFDATNATPERRKWLAQRVAERGSQVVFIETICTNPSVLQANMLLKVRNSPDFGSMSEERAMNDLANRIDEYEKVYVTVQDDEGAYIKLYDLNSKASTHNIFGRMSKTVLPFLLSIHFFPRPITLIPTPEAEDDETANAAFAASVSRLFEGASFRRRPTADKPVRKLQLLSSMHAAAAAAVTALRAEGVAETAVHVCLGTPLGPVSRDSVHDLTKQLSSCLLDVEASMQSVVVLGHQSMCRLIRAYLVGVDVDVWHTNIDSPISAGAKALSAGQAAVRLDVQLNGDVSEQIISLETGEELAERNISAKEIGDGPGAQHTRTAP